MTKRKDYYKKRVELIGQINIGLSEVSLEKLKEIRDFVDSKVYDKIDRGD